jgi:hypothetical protein
MTMLRITRAWLAVAVGLVLSHAGIAGAAAPVSIDGTDFRISGAVTYPGTPVEGLLLNSRMANAIFDDENPSTVSMWKYPDTGRWDPERNLNEFVAALPAYAAKGLRAVSINLQGGNPVPGCSCNATHAWNTSAYHADGSLKAAWMSRADRAIGAAAQHGIVVMLGVFYHGQDQRLADEAAVKRAVDNVTDWGARAHQRPARDRERVQPLAHQLLDREESRPRADRTGAGALRGPRRGLGRVHGRLHP